MPKEKSSKRGVHEPEAKPKRHKRRKTRAKRKSKDDPEMTHVKPSVPIPPPPDSGPPVPGFNLAGRPANLNRGSGRLKKQEVKTQGTFHSSNISNDPFIHFVVRSNKHEWIRFKPDSFSLVIYGTIKNPQKKENVDATAEEKAAKWSLRSLVGNPAIYLDPSMAGSAFFHSVSVSINNVPVPTNSCIGPLLLQYIRCSRVFRSKTSTKFTNENEMTLPTTANTTTSASLAKALAPFDYGTVHNASMGNRIPVYLDGVFPFSSKNLTLESIDRTGAPNLYFPPDTTIDIKVHAHRTKMEALFLPTMDFKTDYFDRDQSVEESKLDLSLVFQDATIEYESVELSASDEEAALNQFMRGGVGYYYFDIPRGQHQALPASQSYTNTTFQIMPYARLIYIMFTPSWAVIPMESLKRPLSGFSTFPVNCTGIRIGFAGDKALLTDKFENFGLHSNHSEISKKIYHQYLVENKMTSDSFETFFPRSNSRALNQIFVFDLKNQLSDKIELLNIDCEFSGTKQSPKDVQIVCISVHQNGEAVCKNTGTGGGLNWTWEFKQTV